MPITTVNINTPNVNYAVVCVDSRDLYKRSSAFKCVNFPTLEQAERELYNRMKSDIESVMFDYDVQYEGNMYGSMQEFADKCLKGTDRLHDRVAWFDGEGGIIEYSIHEIEGFLTGVRNG